MNWLSDRKMEVFIAAVIVLSGLRAGNAQTSNSQKELSVESVVATFLEEHCIRCHGSKQQKGELRLDTLKPDFDRSDRAGIWIEVMDKMNLGEMPPKDEPRPDVKTHRTVVTWIASELRAARNRKAAVSSAILLRRMNRTEYSNTIRDLLKMEFLPGEYPAEYLPPDATFDGFDKVGSSLMLDSSLLENFYNAAKRISIKAIVIGPPEFPTKRTRFEMENMDKKEFGFAYMCGSPGKECREKDVVVFSGTTRTSRGLFYPGTTQLFPVKGNYTIRVRASAEKGTSEESVRMYVNRQNGREGYLMEVDVDAKPGSPEVYSITRPMVDLPQAFGVYMQVGILKGTKLSVGMPKYWKFHQAMQDAVTAGEHAKAFRLQARMQSEGWTGGNRPDEVMLDTSSVPKLIIDWIEIEGPLYEQWPPRSHELLLFKGSGTEGSAEYVREIFQRFLPRAYRRPVKDSEVGRIVKLVQAEFERGTSFEESVRVGLTYVLTSPDFLYLVEPEEAEETRELNDYELASRLSYFLWSSMPDDRLFQLAETGELNDPAVLQEEVARMIDDPKSEALVNGFAAQWLKTNEFLNFQPDRKIYRDFDQRLREHMAAEPLAFFNEILRQNLSVANFLDSEFVMVNEPLAKFYHLKGIQGNHFRRVKLPEGSPRGGLLGQAGVAMRGSDGVRTKPVNRGVYVREVLFNDPPDPPPPNAGEIEPNIKGERLTVRERLLQHQQIEACASCHRGIDPFGLALENFDVTGAWRTHQNGEEFRGSNTPEIVVNGILPNGKSFTSYEEFKSLLVEQGGRFRRALMEKLFVYAFGRPVEPSDRVVIDSAVDEMIKNGDTIRSAIQAVVATKTFREK